MMERLLAHGVTRMQGDAVAPLMNAEDTGAWLAGLSASQLRLASG